MESISNSGRILDFCLLIPCYNNYTGLLSSLRSVRYSEGLFHVVVVDDGSEEELSIGELHKELGAKYPLTLLRNPENEGIVASLNRGLYYIINNIPARYIARLDCGDICSSDRFELQCRHLSENPEIGLMGSWCIFKDYKTGLSYEYKTPVLHRHILKELPFRSVFIHPTVMFRVDILEKTGLYPVDYPHAEDYALFWKMALVSQTFVINRFLLTCEINRKGISIKNRYAQLASRKKIIHTFARGLSRIAGIIKINLLMVIPHKWILLLKSQI